MKNKKKMGRPTDNPKVDSLNVRLDKESSEILKKYAEKYDITRTESARIGIKKLKEDL